MNIRSRENPLSASYFDASLHILLVDKELHLLLPFVLVIVHESYVTWSSSGLAVLDDPSYTLLFVTACCAKQALAHNLGR